MPTEPRPCPNCNEKPTGALGILVFCEAKGCPNKGHEYTAEGWDMRHGVDAEVAKAVERTKIECQDAREVLLVAARNDERAACIKDVWARATICFDCKEDAEAAIRGWRDAKADACDAVRKGLEKMYAEIPDGDCRVEPEVVIEHALAAIQAADGACKKCVRCGNPTYPKMFTNESDNPCDNCGHGTGKAGETNDGVKP